MSIFEKASKLKLRYETKTGNVSTEDLWDMPLESKRGASLDTLAQALNKELKASNEESFVVKKTRANDELELKFEIVKHVITYKMASAERAEKAAVTKTRNVTILAAIEAKKTALLGEASVEELEAMLKEAG